MNIKAQALFDDTAITGARAFGGPDVTSSAMKTAIREWFDLFFMRVPEREEDPAQRIPCAIIGRLVKACFAEYDSSFNSVPAPGSKADWMNIARKAIDSVKLDVLQWAMVGGECFIKPAPDGTGGLAYQVVRRDCYNVLARGPGGITDVLLCERNHIGEDSLRCWSAAA